MMGMQPAGASLLAVTSNPQLPPHPSPGFGADFRGECPGSLPVEGRAVGDQSDEIKIPDKPARDTVAERGFQAGFWEPARIKL